MHFVDIIAVIDFGPFREWNAEFERPDGSFHVAEPRLPLILTSRLFLTV